MATLAASSHNYAKSGIGRAAGGRPGPVGRDVNSAGDDRPPHGLQFTARSHATGRHRPRDWGPCGRVAPVFGLAF